MPRGQKFKAEVSYGQFAHILTLEAMQRQDVEYQKVQSSRFAKASISSQKNFELCSGVNGRTLILYHQGGSHDVGSKAWKTRRSRRHMPSRDTYLDRSSSHVRSRQSHASLHR